MGETTAEPVQDPTQPTQDPTNPDGNSGAGQSEGKVDPQVIDALTIASLNTIPMSPSFAMASLYQHQITHTKRLDNLIEACHAQMLKRFVDVDPLEAVSNSVLFKGERDSSIQSLLAQLNSGQMESKIAQSSTGSLTTEISKIGAAIGSLQGLIGGLTALLQVAMKNKEPAATLFQKRAAPYPVPTNVPNVPNVPDAPNVPNSPANGHAPDENVTFPKVTIRFTNGT